MQRRDEDALLGIVVLPADDVDSGAVGEVGGGDDSMYGGEADRLATGTPGTLDAIELPSLDPQGVDGSGALRQDDVIDSEESGPIDVSPMGDDSDDEGQDDDGDAEEEY